MKTSLLFIIPLCICSVMYVWQLGEISELEQRNEELKKQCSLSSNKSSISSGGVDSESTFLERSERIIQLAKVLPRLVEEGRTHVYGGVSYLTLEEQDQYLLLLEEFRRLEDDELLLQLENIKESTMLDGRDWVKIALLLIKSISEERPALALDLIDDSLEEWLSSCYFSIQSILVAWADVNPEESFHWLQSKQKKLEAGKMNTKRLEDAMFIQIAKKNPALVIEHGIQNKDLTSFFFFIENVAHSLNSNDERSRFVIAFRQGMESLVLKGLNVSKRESGYQSVIGSLTYRMMHESSQKGIDWISKNLTAAEKESFAHGIVNEGVGRRQEVHPVHVANRSDWGTWLLNELPATPSNREIVREYVALWIHGDHVTAGEWLNSQTPSPMKNEAIYAYSSKLSPHDPKTAMEWAQALPSSSRKEDLIISIQAQ